MSEVTDPTPPSAGESDAMIDAVSLPLSDARRAVDAAGVPDDLRPAAYAKALELLLGVQAPGRDTGEARVRSQVPPGWEQHAGGQLHDARVCDVCGWVSTEHDACFNPTAGPDPHHGQKMRRAKVFVVASEPVR